MMERNEDNQFENIFKVCYNHKNPVTYSASYENCPACGFEKVTRISLGMD